MVENLKTSETSLKAGLTYWLYVVSLVSNWRLLRFIFFIFLDLLNTATTCNVEPESCLCLRLLLMAVGLRPYGKVAASELLLFLVYCSLVWVIRAAGRNGKGFLPFLSLPGDLVSPPPFNSRSLLELIRTDSHFCLSPAWCQAHTPGCTSPDWFHSDPFPEVSLIC